MKLPKTVHVRPSFSMELHVYLGIGGNWRVVLHFFLYFIIITFLHALYFILAKTSMLTHISELLCAIPWGERNRIT